MPSATLQMILLDVAMIAYTGWILARAGLPATVRHAVAGSLCLLLLPLIALFSPDGAMPRAISGPLFLAVVVAYVGVVGAIFLGVGPIRRAVLALDDAALLLPQGIRVFFGAGFLAQAATGVLPPTFGILDGFTHVTAGFLGLLAASFAARGRANALSWLANLFGLADILIVATTLALVLLPTITARHPMMFAVFLPAPIWAWFHLFAIARLLRAPAAVDRAPSIATAPGWSAR